MTALSLDSSLDAIALVRSVINDDREAQQVIITSSDTSKLITAVAVFAAQLVTAMSDLDSADACDFLNEWQRQLITQANTA